MGRKKGAPTPSDIKKQAERTYKHFSAKSVLKRLGIKTHDVYFYVYGFIPDSGKCVCWGPLGGEEADAAARGLLEGEVFELETIDLKKAKSEIKAELARRGVDLGTALQPMSSQRI